MSNDLDLGKLLDDALAAANAMDGTLDEKNARYWDVERRYLPQLEVAYNEFIARAAAAGSADAAPAAGSDMPEFILPDSEGHLVTLTQFLARGPLVLSFNRGHWCPFCSMELRALARAHGEITALGAEVVSIVPETAAYSRQMREDYGLPFEVLTDVDHGYALENGLVVAPGDFIKQLYLGFGIDFPKFQRNEGWFMPTPATFVVDPAGVVISRHVDVDFRKRMAISDILACLRKL